MKVRIQLCSSALSVFMLMLSLLCVQTAPAAPVYHYKVIARYPHSTSSYTEGFFFRDGLFYEGTGIKGHSQVLIYEPSGKIAQHYDVPPQYFGEGIVDWGDNLLEWTWQSNVGVVLDRASLRPIRQFHYTGEGWGMTRTDRELITSDGTAILRFRNPDTFDETRMIVVRDGATPVRNLNELEYIKGEIYANVWHSDRIARISPADGHVIAWIDCTGLLAPGAVSDPEAVLNGIAYDARRDRLFVTGKEWPTIFEIKLLPATK
jgi:glutamine cyclotransferase